MLLSLLSVAFVTAYAVRGWRRGLVVEVVELVGIVSGVLAASLAWPAIDAITGGWASAFAGLVVFSVTAVGGVLAARWAGRHTRELPVAGRAVDGAGGTVFAATWSLLLVTGLLTLGVTVPGARMHTARPICDAPVARVLISRTNPLHEGGERLAVLGRPVLLWLNRHLSNGGLTLAHRADRCAHLPSTTTAGGRAVPAPFTFPAVGEHEIVVDSAAERLVFDLLNRARREEGLRPLVWDDLLGKVARGHSRSMYLRGYFAHETPECWRGDGDRGRCRDPFDRMELAGVVYEVAGENLALAPTPDAAHRGLMDSPGHRENILSSDYLRVGIGVWRGPYGLMVSQEFMR